MGNSSEGDQYIGRTIDEMQAMIKPASVPHTLIVVERMSPLRLMPQETGIMFTTPAMALTGRRFEHILIAMDLGGPKMSEPERIATLSWARERLPTLFRLPGGKPQYLVQQSEMTHG